MQSLTKRFAMTSQPSVLSVEGALEDYSSYHYQISKLSSSRQEKLQYFETKERQNSSNQVIGS